MEDNSGRSIKTSEVTPTIEKNITQPESNRAMKVRKSTDPPKTGMCLAVYTVFKELIYRILPQIKDKPYFIWPLKMGGDLTRRESKPYCTYHREHGHLTEQC